MKTILLLFTFLGTLLGTFNAYSAPVWKSTFIDLKNDCVVVSSATDQAPIDFYKADCKSFAGFTFIIEGGDLRYSPELYFRDNLIDLQRPPQFHDMASDKVEWLYTHEIDNQGSGNIVWRGIIYQLSIADDDGGNDKTVYFSVRLDGKNSCLIGTSGTDTEARELVYHSAKGCK
ncbi:MAG: hypothetical protein PHY93_11175 [Bacteriovorax sp.]|nr:hypothetical protein [Bacteriovorax sp.]